MNRIAIIGAGTMGAGIAQLAATHGCAVLLFDMDGDAVSRALGGIKKRLDQSVQKKKRSASDAKAILARIEPKKGAIGDLDGVELAIEAVAEDLNVKRGVFRLLEAGAPKNAILATNTSSLCVGEIASCLDDPSRVVGMHFFNPAPVMPLVEIIPGAQTDASCVDACFKIAGRWGKTPVQAKDTPGFIVNRIARGFYLEALRLLEEGVAGVSEIDLVMRIHGKFKMGPFELMDLVGVDVNLAVGRSIFERLGKPARLAPRGIQQSLVEQGFLGRKTGRGFYSYENDAILPACLVDRRSFDLSPLLNDVMLAFSFKAGAAQTNSTEQYIFCRILAAVINEAGLAYEESVATSDDIDIAMTKGANYPTGPLAWADEIGYRNVRGVLSSLNEAADDGRYEPATLFGS